MCLCSPSPPFMLRLHRKSFSYCELFTLSPIQAFNPTANVQAVRVKNTLPQEPHACVQYVRMYVYVVDKPWQLEHISLSLSLWHTPHTGTGTHQSIIMWVLSEWESRPSQMGLLKHILICATDENRIDVFVNISIRSESWPLLPDLRQYQCAPLCAYEKK